MNKPYVIVFGTDFSEHAAIALRAAIAQGQRHAPAELHILHALPIGNAKSFPFDPVSGLAAPPTAGVEEQEGAPLSYLDDELGKIPAAELLGVRIHAHVWRDNPGFSLVDLATQLEADLLVVGSHGRQGVARWLLGSVAEAVVRHASCPVLVVPPRRQLELPTIEPPCPDCLAARRATSGAQLWCERHRERHGRRHTYYQRDRASTEASLPLVFRE